jgi:hypothetical protein
MLYSCTPVFNDNRQCQRLRICIRVESGFLLYTIVGNNEVVRCEFENYPSCLVLYEHWYPH